MRCRTMRAAPSYCSTSCATTTCCCWVAACPTGRRASSCAPPRVSACRCPRATRWRSWSGRPPRKTWRWRIFWPLSGPARASCRWPPRIFSPSCAAAGRPRIRPVPQRRRWRRRRPGPAPGLAMARSSSATPARTARRPSGWPARSQPPGSRSGLTATTCRPVTPGPWRSCRASSIARSSSRWSRPTPSARTAAAPISGASGISPTTWPWAWRRVSASSCRW